MATTVCLQLLKLLSKHGANPMKENLRKIFLKFPDCTLPQF